MRSITRAFTKAFRNFSTTSISERILTDEPPKHQAASRPSWKEEAFRNLVA
jgi:hypothetical protein